jgi:hypothetical protein
VGRQRERVIDEYEIRECVYEQDGKVAKRENIRGKSAPD